VSDLSSYLQAVSCSASTFLGSTTENNYSSPSIRTPNLHTEEPKAIISSSMADESNALKAPRGSEEALQLPEGSAGVGGWKTPPVRFVFLSTK
jgi:hypothetical protein